MPLVAACVAIVVIPMVASDFVLLQIVIKSLWLGIAGASLAFLIGPGPGSSPWARRRSSARRAT